MDYEFDENNCALMGGFLTLKEKCFFFEKYFLGEGFFNTNLNKFNFIYYRSFYSDFRDVCDLPLFFLINEEISNAHGRDHLQKLIKQVFKSKSFTAYSQDENKQQREDHQYNDIIELVKYRYNGIVGSAMLDFTVSSFSVFDRWINVLYEKACCEHKDRIIKSRIKKVSAHLEKYKQSSAEHSAEEISKKILSIPGNFISLPDKVSGIYKLIDKKSYAGDFRKDIDIINFLSRKRNTVHNLGEHRGQNQTITVDGIDHELWTGKPAHSASWLNSLELIGHLIKIYTNLLSSIPNRTDFMDGFIEAKLDNQAIIVLTETINDFLGQHGLKEEWTARKGDFADFLVRKFSFSSKQSEVFIGNIMNLEKKNLSGEDTIILLAMPNPK